MFQYISECDLAEFVNRFPDAVRFLEARSLKGEYEYLFRCRGRNEWQEKRLRELTVHFNLRKELWGI